MGWQVRVEQVTAKKHQPRTNKEDTNEKNFFSIDHALIFMRYKWTCSKFSQELFRRCTIKGSSF
jgi:hypothetical protein